MMDDLSLFLIANVLRSIDLTYMTPKSISVGPTKIFYSYKPVSSIVQSLTSAFEEGSSGYFLGYLFIGLGLKVVGSTFVKGSYLSIAFSTYS